jgi:hypothetical protein
MVEIVGRHDLILDSFVEELNGVLGVVAPENKQILDSELVRFGPPDFEALLLLLVWLEGSLVEEVEYFLVVDLEEGDGDGDCFVFAGLRLIEQVVHCSDWNAAVRAVNHHFASTVAIHLLPVLIALHWVRLAWACLSVREHSRVVAFNDFGAESWNLKLLVDLLLAGLCSNNFIEFKVLLLLVADVDRNLVATDL